MPTREGEGVIVKGFINLYRSGVYHTLGKVSTYDRHGGDVYETRMAAIYAIEPLSHYIGTVEIEWWELTAPTVVNGWHPADLVPNQDDWSMGVFHANESLP